MPVFSVSSALPRQELALAVVEGASMVKTLIGHKILPEMPLTRRTAHLIKATLADSQGLRHIAAAKYIHSPGTKFERIIAKLGDSTVTVDLRGVEIVVPNETEKDYAEYLDIEAFYAGRFGKEIYALTSEYLIAAQVFNTANTAAGAATNSAVAYTSGNSATISFIADVIASIRRLRALGEQPDSVVMSGPVYERIRQGAPVQAYVRGTLYAGAETTVETIQKALASYGIKQVLIGEGYYNTAADNATASLSQLWSNTYIAVCKAGEVGGGSNENDPDGADVPLLGGLGTDAYWEGYAPGGVVSADKDAQSFSGGVYVESYPSLDLDSMVLRLKMSNKPYIANTRCLDLIATQYS